MGPFYQVLYAFVRPSNLLTVVLVVGVIGALARRRWAARLLVSATVVIVFVMIFPVGKWMFVPLENRFHAPSPMPDHVDGIIVLGGAVRGHLTYLHGQPNLNEHAERMTEAVALAHRYPAATIIFTGGNKSEITEADVARMFFQEQGIDLSRVLLEDKSHSTHDNAVLMKKLLKPRPGQVWLLVTSAYHMPRSVGAFRKVGWHVVPYPVDYLTSGHVSAASLPDLGRNLHGFDDATRAWLALISYYATGKSDALFPGPR